MTTSLPELFAAAVRRTPDAPAVCHAADTLTYADCDRRAEALARLLREHVPAGGRVGLNLRKSPRAIVAMLACLRAGLPYVPIDPLAPLPRRRAILEDSAAAAILLDERAAGEWEADPGALAGRLVLGPDADPAPVDAGGWPAPGPDDPAYVLYTSGSTGRPKGVEITHRNAASFVAWGMRTFGVRADDRLAVHAPLHFDLPVFDVYAGLAGGATICLVDERTVLFPAALLRFLVEHRITILYAVPTAYVGLVQYTDLARTDLSHLRLALYAGEEFHPTPLRALADALPDTRIWNLYGPIETNVVTAHEVTRADLERTRIPIGRPVDHVELLLVDPALAVVREPGVEGEIVVSGASVCRGYLGRPDLTAQSRAMVVDGDRTLDCYRTGDFARWDADGVLHFLGRKDLLVKTRGFRIEAGDVEATLLRHPAVAEAVVVPVPHPEHTSVLHAAVVPAPGAALDEAALLGWCRAELPAYMVPATFDVRQALPRTSTGKADRVALRAHAETVAAGAR